MFKSKIIFITLQRNFLDSDWLIRRNCRQVACISPLGAPIKTKRNGGVTRVASLLHLKFC
jgi:hypothetical protein